MATKEVTREKRPAPPAATPPRPQAPIPLPPKAPVRPSGWTAGAPPAAPAKRVPAEATVSGVKIPQYRRRTIFAIWAAATLPMGVLAWLIAPALADGLAGGGDVPMFKALGITLTGALIWQFVLVVALVGLEQRTLRWSTLREALWLGSPRSPRSGRIGGRLWLVLIPLIALFAVAALIPTFPHADDRDLGAFFGSDAGESFLSGNWGWFGLILVFLLFNTVLGEELLFRGFLLPRMNGAFGRGDWAANGVLFTAYHVHVPWMMPATLLIDTFALSYPTKRYRSTWIAIAVHSAQSVFLAVILLALVF